MQVKYAKKEKDLVELMKKPGAAADPDADPQIKAAMASLAEAGTNLGKAQATIETEEKEIRTRP